MRKFFGLLILMGLFFVVPGEIFTVEGSSITEKEVRSHKHTVENCFVYIEMNHLSVHHKIYIIHENLYILVILLYIADHIFYLYYSLDHKKRLIDLY